MESGLLRTPMTNNDMVLGSGQFSKCSSSAPSAHLLCSLILWLGGIGRLGGLRGTGATAGWTRTGVWLRGPRSPTGPDPNQALSTMGPW